VGKKTKNEAPKPDPLIGQAAWQQAMLGKEFLEFSKQAWADSNKRQDKLDGLTEEVTRQQLGIARDQEAWAREDRERYKNVFQPIEDEFIAEAKDYGSQTRQAQAAAEAKADVQAQAAQAREAGLRQSASLGINPASGRYAGINRTTDLATGLAAAGAQNTARQQMRDKGLALKADIASMGKGLPAQSAATMGLGLQAGAGAVGMNQNNQQMRNASTNIMNTGYSGAMQGWAGAGQTMNNLYGNQLQAWSAENKMKAANASGIGSFLGSMAGFGLSFSDKNMKENKQPIEEGKALKAVNEMPVEEWDYKQGVADEGSHIGTYAQDFQKATGKGDGQTIAFQDAIGITMKAVQDLDDKVDKLAAQMPGIGRNNRVKDKKGAVK